MNWQALFDKLSHTNWTPKHASKYISNWPGLEGQLNLAWILAGKPERIDKAFLHGEHWKKAYLLGALLVDNIPLREYATLFSEQEFYQFSKKHMALIGRHVPVKDWPQLFGMAVKP